MSSAAERIRNIPIDLAKKQLAEDPRPLSEKMANDIELARKLEPHTERWTEAMYRLRVEVEAVREAEGKLAAFVKACDDEENEHLAKDMEDLVAWARGFGK